MRLKNITAYSDEISRFPGESLEIKVSSVEAGQKYDARLIRIIHGDTNPNGPGYKEEYHPSHIEGSYTAKHQPIRHGSYATIPGSTRLGGLQSFTVQAQVMPTLPGKGEQALVSFWNPGSQSGFVLSLNEDSKLRLTLGDGRGGTWSLDGAGQLLSPEWYSVSATFDAQSKQVTLSHRAHQQYALTDNGDKQTATAPVTPAFDADMALLFGAKPLSTSDARFVGQHFNGKIDRPRLSGRVLSETEIVGLEAPKPSLRGHRDLLGIWDFSIGIETQEVTDIGAYQLHGTLVNMPVRAVRGANWDGCEMNWRHAPEQYGAIHFHEDSLYDSEWETDFTLTVPEGLRSGLYAVHLTCENDEEYVPFVVKARPNETKNKLVYLCPTASYLAYANEHMPTNAVLAELLTDQLAVLYPEDVFLNEHREYGASCYDVYNDGAGVCYTSRLRPILNMRPKYASWLGGTGSSLWQFNADTHVTDWLETKGHDHDIISDEDLHDQGLESLAPYTVLITSSHSEYWSKEMWDAVDAFKKRGGRVISMGGNTWYWRVAYHKSAPGIMEVRRAEDGTRGWAAQPGEYYHSFTGEYGGLWRRQGKAPQAMCGTGFIAQGFDISAPYSRDEGSFNDRAAFIFEGIGKDEVIGDFGLIGGGAAGLEVDVTDRQLGTPPNTLVLASSGNHTDIYQLVAEEILINYPSTGGTQCPRIKAELAFFETAEGGAVFSSSSIAWAGSLSHNNYENNVSKIMDNVVTRFLDDTPFA